MNRLSTVLSSFDRLHLHVKALADLFLDTPQYNGHGTAPRVVHTKQRVVDAVVPAAQTIVVFKRILFLDTPQYTGHGTAPREGGCFL